MKPVTLLVCALGALVSFISLIIFLLIDISNENHEHGVLLMYLLVFGWTFFFLGNQISKSPQK